MCTRVEFTYIGQRPHVLQRAHKYEALNAKMKCGNLNTEKKSENLNAKFKCRNLNTEKNFRVKWGHQSDAVALSEDWVFCFQISTIMLT